MEIEEEEQKAEIKENNENIGSKNDGNLETIVVNENDKSSKSDQQVNSSKESLNSRHNRHSKEHEVSVKNSIKPGDRDCSTKRRELS